MENLSGAFDYEQERRENASGLVECSECGHVCLESEGEWTQAMGWSDEEPCWQCPECRQLNNELMDYTGEDDE